MMIIMTMRDNDRDSGEKVAKRLFCCSIDDYHNNGDDLAKVNTN